MRSSWVRSSPRLPRCRCTTRSCSRRPRSATDRLQRALSSRAVIDQAIGIIRSRSGATAEEAFDRLAKLSQADNLKLNVVAERLVDEAVRRARTRHGAH